MKKEVKKNVMKNKILLNVAVENDAWFEAVDFDAEKVAQTIKDITFEHVASLNHELLSEKDNFSLNVCLSDDESVHHLNKEFRGMDKPTNVLSFANIDDDFFWETLEEEKEAELGDMKQISKRVNEVIDKGEEGDILSKIYDVISVVLILLSVSFILLETFAIPQWLHRTLFVFEVAIASLFAVEYLLRVWTAPYEYPNLRPDKARMVYIFSFMSLIDLLSIVPVFVANLPTASGILKIFKLCKILRLVKASRYLSGIANFGRAIQKKKKQIIMSIIAMVVLVLICSVLLYSVENKAQPEVFKNAFSGVLYSLQTIFDSDSEVVLTTPAGQALSTMMLLLGGCMIGVPIAIIATGFEDMIAEQAGEEKDDDKDLYEVLRGYDQLSKEEKQRFQRIVQAETEQDTPSA